MPTLYCDFENGNDNYAGSSFALLASGTDGRISSTTFSSATANFPNDGSLIGQYLSIFNGSIYAVYNVTAWVSSTSLTIAAISGGTGLANQTTDRQFYIGGRWKSLTNGATAVRTIPGDTVRIMGSPAPTSLGQNGVWTSQALQATKSISSSTNATPISVTVNAHGYSTGDTVVITGHTTNTNANGTWEITSTGANTFTLDGSVGNGVGGASGTVRPRNNTRVMLSTAVTQNIASTGPGRAVWTSADAANVTTSFSTDAKEHYQSDIITIGAGFTTGLAAYWPLPSALDLSSYQQVSFWIRQTSGVIGGNAAISLRLCSDTAGVTTVSTVNVPGLATSTSSGRWMPVTVDLGTSLGNNIQSIALYVNTDNGAQTFLLSNIIACKASSAADSLTLTSLIGKNTTGETFWGVQSINGRRVMLDADTNARPFDSTVRGYYGTSETVTTWKRETIKLGPAAASTTILQSINEGSVTFSGGWDRTNMSSQNLETWLDGQNGNGHGIDAQLTNDLGINTIAMVRFNRALNVAGVAYFGAAVSLIAANNNTGASAGAVVFGMAGAFDAQFMCANGSSAIQAQPAGPLRMNLGQVLSNATSISVLPTGPNSTLTGNFYNNLTHGFQPATSSGLKVLNAKFADNATGGIRNLGTQAYCVLYLKNCLVSDGVTIDQTGLDSYIYSHDHDQIAGNHKVFVSGGLISSATDERKTVSGLSWKIQPTNSFTRVSSNPLSLSLAKVAVAANALVTVKAWMRRDNSGLTMRLVCKGGQIAGVANDVTASVTTTNAWEEETITFTPTETGVVEITAEAWGGTTFSGWVDDLTISQA
jgi:hypothetical protein